MSNKRNKQTGESNSPRKIVSILDCAVAVAREVSKIYYDKRTPGVSQGKPGYSLVETGEAPTTSYRNQFFTTFGSGRLGRWCLRKVSLMPLKLALISDGVKRYREEHTLI
jgi:hypothetical protein